jgi:hypothetical protein
MQAHVCCVAGEIRLACFRWKWLIRQVLEGIADQVANQAYRTQRGI